MEKKKRKNCCIFAFLFRARLLRAALRGGGLVFFLQNTKRQCQSLFAELILMDVEQVTRQQVFPDQQSQGVKWGWGCTSVTHQNVTLQHYLLAMFQFFSARYTVCLLPTANLF